MDKSWAVFHNDEIVFLGTREQAEAWKEDILDAIVLCDNKHDNQIDIWATKFWGSFKVVNVYADDTLDFMPFDLFDVAF